MRMTSKKSESQWSRLAWIAVLTTAAGFASGQDAGSWAKKVWLDEITRRTKVALPADSAVRRQAIETNQVLVHLAPGADASSVAIRSGATSWRMLEASSEFMIMVGASNADAVNLRVRLQRDPDVVGAYPVRIVPAARDGFTPNDPFYFPNNPAAPWPGQWYLTTANVQPAWNANYTGTGVVVAMVDDGVETTHADLASNYNATNSYDYGQGDPIPLPVYADDIHGTAVSGIAAGVGGNGIGITGVAPGSSFAMIRLDFNSVNFDTQATNATLYRSSGAIKTIRIKNHSYGPTSPYVSSATQTAAIVTSANAGTIHVRSAGNARGTIAEDVNKFTERNIPETITVGSISESGVFQNTSSFGAALFCSAPAGTTMITTDRTGEGLGYNGSADTFPNADYTSRFGYTSGAAPVVAGSLALIKQIKPLMDIRFAKHLLAKSCKVIDASDSTSTSDGGWKTNAAGYKFNQNYGFGQIDVGAMVTNSALYSGVTSSTSTQTSVVSVASVIPDNSTTGVTRTFSIASTDKMEELQVKFNITHSWRGDVEAYATSPSGTTSRLFIGAGGDNGASIDWTFTSNAFWGENPAGTWTLKVIDTQPVDVGTWNSYQATVRMGELIPVATIVRGTINLENIAVSPAGQIVNFQLKDNADVVVATATATLDGSGNYEFTTPTMGTYKLLAQGKHWLKKAIPSITLNGTTQTGKNFTLANADVDRDNVVSIFDYIRLSDTFDLDNTASNWNTPDGDNITPGHSDLDEDGVVSVFDYIIMSDNFDLTGDE